jgi:hypothetical protein
MAEQNIDSHRNKNESEVTTVAARWVITQDSDRYQERIQKFIPRYGVSVVARAIWKCSGIALQLKLNFSLNPRSSGFDAESILCYE